MEWNFQYIRELTKNTKAHLCSIYRINSKDILSGLQPLFELQQMLLLISPDSCHLSSPSYKFCLCFQFCQNIIISPSHSLIIESSSFDLCGHFLQMSEDKPWGLDFPSRALGQPVLSCVSEPTNPNRPAWVKFLHQRAWVTPSRVKSLHWTARAVLPESVCLSHCTWAVSTELTWLSQHVFWLLCQHSRVFVPESSSQSLCLRVFIQESSSQSPKKSSWPVFLILFLQIIKSLDCTPRFVIFWSSITSS